VRTKHLTTLRGRQEAPAGSSTTTTTSGQPLAVIRRHAAVHALEALLIV
jgi:hypothetical protein